MTIGIEDADEFIRWNLTHQALTSTACACTGDGHVDPCERCEAAERGVCDPSNLLDLIVGIGAAIRNGLPFATYEKTLRACDEATIVATVSRYDPSWLELLLDEVDDAVIADLKDRRRLGAEHALCRLVTERERAECLIRGLRRLLKVVPNRAVRRRFRRIVRKVGRFDEIASGTRSLIRINDVRASIRKTIRDRKAWWLYRYDGCVMHPDGPALTASEKAHVASCHDCRFVIDGIARIADGIDASALERMKEFLFDDRS